MRLLPIAQAFTAASLLVASVNLSAQTPTSPRPAQAAAPAAVPDLPPRTVAPTDRAQFRRFVLPNGLRVLLMSDPDLNKSSGSLAVTVGQIDDPKDHEGLAHFLEHMISQSTAKYPVTGGFTQFIRQNGGVRNAYTSSDHSNYQFDIRHEALEEALDRFAQIFVAPLFNPQFVALEVNAVHNESMRYITDDARRTYRLRSELYNPESGESKFSAGNKETLAKANSEVVRDFWVKTYSADRMSLAITGRASLDKLEQWVRDKFSAVERRPVTLVPRSPDFLPRKAALRIARVESINELRQLQLEFVIPATRKDFAGRSGPLLSQLASNTAPGGLLAHLRQAGLANNLSSFIWERTSDYGSFWITADLTQKGLEQYETVLNRIHAWLTFLQSQPYPRAYFDDRARIAALNETYGNRGEGMDLAVTLANQALFFPLEVAERAGVVWGKPDEPSYRSLLAALRPDNMLVTLAARGLKTDKRERVYGVAYAYDEQPGTPYTSLLSPTPVAEFTLPGANRFMPAKVDLIKADAGTQPDRPTRLINEPGLVLHHSPDVDFQRPQTAVNLRFVPDKGLQTPQASAHIALWVRAATEALEADIADARQAGVTATLGAGAEGVTLSVSGYGDSALRVARHLATQLRRFELTPARFSDLHEQVLRGLRSYPRSEAYLLALGRSGALATEHNWLPDQLLVHTQSATQADAQKVGQRLFDQGRLEALIHGHVTAQEASTAARAIAQTLGSKPAAANQLFTRRHLSVGVGEHVVDAGLIEGPNALWLVDYQVEPSDAPRLRALTGLVAMYVNTPFFTELRTRQQLGYIVASGQTVSDRARRLRFFIQGSNHSAAELRDRAEAYMKTLPDALAAINNADWAGLKASLRAQLEAKPKSISERAARLASAAYTYEGEWDRPEETVRASVPLTQADAANFLRELIDPAKARRVTVMLDPKARPPAQPVAPTFTDRDAWKATRQFR